MTGARPDQMNITFSPSVSNCLRLPERKPSPRPTSSSSEPTPQAMPNMVKNERSLCAQRARKVCPTISKMRRTLESYYTVTSNLGLRTSDLRPQTLDRRCSELRGTLLFEGGRESEVQGLRSEVRSPIFVPNRARVGYSLAGLRQ